MTFRHGARGFCDVFARGAEIFVTWHRMLGRECVVPKRLRVQNPLKKIPEHELVVPVVEPPLQLFEVTA